MAVEKRVFADTEVKKVLGGTIRTFFTRETVGTEDLMFVMGDFVPGEGLEPHTHEEQEEVYYCISGNGTVWYGEDKKETPIEPGVGLWIPRGVEHAVENTGNEQLIIAFFLAPGRKE
jgi:mannose-6-phosphate isomerase-like protein (cupin superfamily)